MELLRRRYKSAVGHWVFPSTRGTLRDSDAASRRASGHALGGAAPARFPAAGGDPAGHGRSREIADYLGHERVSMRQDV